MLSEETSATGLVTITLQLPPTVTAQAVTAGESRICLQHFSSWPVSVELRHEDRALEEIALATIAPACYVLATPSGPAQVLVKAH